MNQQLQESLAEQKRISAQLATQTEDLDQQKTKTKKILHSKELLENILQSSIEYSIIALDLDLNILIWNEGARCNYGYTADEVVMKHTVTLLHDPEDVKSEIVKRFFNKALQKGKADGIFKRIRKDGSYFIASVLVNLRKNNEDNPVGYLVISKDITESQKVEDQLIKSNQELEQFAYITSHDLKAPLRAIERLASWIEEDCSTQLDAKSKENLRLLRQRVKRMANLIDGILQYSRAGRIDLDIHLVNTKQLLQEVIDMLNPPEAFSIHFTNDLPIFYAAKIPLSQVFFNLISNSIKHQDKPEGIIEIGVRNTPKFYLFFVKDNGPGIEPIYFEKIFKIFQTLKARDEHECTGVGLSIVKKIVESQGGYVSVESILNKGATFYFSWPKVPEKNISTLSSAK